MNRRGFLQSCLALAAAPMVVKAANLMPVRPLARTGKWYYEIRTENQITLTLPTAGFQVGDILRITFENGSELQVITEIRESGVIVAKDTVLPLRGRDSALMYTPPERFRTLELLR